MWSKSHPLYSAQLRFERADKHLAEAEGLIREFSKACEHHLVAEHDKQTGGPLIMLKTTPELPIHLPLAVSDAIHNMRAALDYIVYELARYDSGKIQNGTQFPIEDVKSDPTNPKRGFDARIQTYLRGVSRPHVDMIEKFQPYMGKKWTKTLSDISNPDKHRTLTVLTDNMGLFHITTRSIGIVRSGLDDRGIVLPGLDHYAFEIDAGDAIRIAPPDPQGPALMPLLRSLEAQITGAIELFKPEFKII